MIRAWLLCTVSDRTQRLLITWRRIVAFTPPGRMTERRFRAELGMGRKHPEHFTPPSAKVTWLLDELQRDLWPENEWVDVIRFLD